MRRHKSDQTSQHGAVLFSFYGSRSSGSCAPFGMHPAHYCDIFISPPQFPCTIVPWSKWASKESTLDGVDVYPKKASSEYTLPLLRMSFQSIIFVFTSKSLSAVSALPCMLINCGYSVSGGMVVLPGLSCNPESLLDLFWARRIISCLRSIWISCIPQRIREISWG